MTSVEKLNAAIAALDGWMRPYVYAAPETLRVDVREAMALWAAMRQVLEVALAETTDEMTAVEKPYWLSSLALADAILGDTQ